ncbi:MFS transporter [Limobrevibacterium gyesilva]|uniref:MFS transporter n=1 Tax=Limobrevibacterium gyesilva TaxID=2991712 RepID=A0AA41YK77_9PROT|nr:MFS transporter [Limobrevibacterium gyesilva]MCW3473677.1 MFS transporter [Limobrevibacterium gyesilva]
MSATPRSLALALGTTQTLAWATTYYIPATMVTAATESFGVSRTVLLGGFSWSLLVAGVCAPRIGRFIDRNGGRPVLAAGAVITCAGLLALAASANVPMWYFAWTILGVGMALGLYDTAFATIGRLLGSQARPAIVGVTMMAGFASTIGWPAGSWLVHEYGWRIAVMLFAAVQVVAILPIVLLFVPPAPAEAPPSPARQAADGDVKLRAAFILLAVFFTARAAISSLISVHALTLLAGIGLSAEQAVFTAAMIGPAQVASRVIDWRFARNLSPVTSSWLGAALLPLGVAALLGGAPALVFALAYGMSNGILTISRGTLPMHVFGPAGYASLLGRLALPSLVAQAVTPTLLAPLIDNVPASWMFAALGLVSFAVLGCLLPLRR